MSKRITVRISEIKAAMLFASTDDSRFVLNGVHFQARENDFPIMVATDGRRLCVIESESPQDEGVQPFELTIKTDALKAIVGFAKQFGEFGKQIAIEYHPSQRIVVEFANRVFVDYEKDAVIEIPYPMWREVIPTGVQKEPISTIAINAELVSDFAKVAKALECEPGIHCNLFSETGAFEVRFSSKPNVYAVVCPMKPDSEPKWQPEFLGLVSKG
jgi:hypothetical protein